MNGGKMLEKYVVEKCWKNTWWKNAGKIRGGKIVITMQDNTHGIDIIPRTPLGVFYTHEGAGLCLGYYSLVVVRVYGSSNGR